VYTTAQLVELTGVPTRTLNHYVHEGLLPLSEGAYWTEAHYHRLVAINILQQQGVRRLVTIKARLDAMTPEAMAEFVGANDEEEPEEENDEHDVQEEQDGVQAEGTTADAPPAAASTPGPESEALPATRRGAPVGPGSVAGPDASPQAHGAAWTHHVLAHGLELHVSADVDPQTRLRAEEILARFRG